MNTSSDIPKSTAEAKPIAPKVKELVEKSKSVILGTVDADGKPNSSYAPFLKIESTYYVLVSFMARHTKNLRDQKKVSMMFIADEANSKQIYARERLTFDALTEQIERNSDKWNNVIPALKEKYGKVLDVISPMEDFILIAIHPISGSYVNGFGSAYIIDTNLEVLTHRNDIAHGTIPEDN